MPLLVVATPIGNLGDVTRRAIDALQSAEIILAEDTRHSRKLLCALGLDPARLRSYHDHSAERTVRDAVARMQEGAVVALISDAGTPGVSDPGFPLVRAAHDAGIQVHAVPGASALTAFLSVAALPADTVLFVGFPPRRPQARAAALCAWMARSDTLVLYESPNRAVALLEQIAAVDPDRLVAVGRELTKLHEEVLRGTARAVAESFAAREAVQGEFVIGVAGRREPEAPEDAVVEAWVAELAATELPTKRAAEVLARRLGGETSSMYARLVAARERGAT